MGKKNYDKSVKTRLLNLMNETGYKYMVSSGKILQRETALQGFCKPVQGQILVERRFLLYAMNGLEARPTVDVGLWRTGSVVAGISWLVYSKKSWVSYAMKMGCHLTQEVSK